MSDEGRTSDRAQAPSLAGPRIAALVLVALGALIVFETLSIRSANAFSPLGPRFAPLVVGIAMAVLGALLLVRTTWLPDRQLADRCGEQEAATHWSTVGIVGVALLAYAFALGVLGYLVATALFVPVAARILGSGRPVRDAIVGSALATVIYFGFTELLGVRLPAGMLDLVL